MKTEVQNTWKKNEWVEGKEKTKVVKVLLNWWKPQKERSKKSEEQKAICESVSERSGNENKQVWVVYLMKFM